MAGRLFTIVALAAAAAIIGVLWFEREVSDPGSLTEPVTIMVPTGVGVSAIADELERQGVVADANYVVLRARWRNEAHLLKAGEYVFEPAVSVDQVLDVLIEGRTVIHKVTVPEGLTSLEIVDILNGAELLEGEIAEVPPQGAVLPETYHFERSDTRQQVLDRMVDAMDSTLAELWPNRAEDLPIASPEEAVILASIVEKETGVAEERAHIAGVFVNRLNLGMRLQSDPTVIYALTRGLEPLGRAPLRSDWEYDDPYNTYVYAGLPPGPIASPGRDAIAAVLNPLETKDIYFVADGTGGHAFAETLAEHNRNVAAYRSLQNAE
ncbi:MAG: endolytic transglycosylase MltG [Rhodospirillales bacterium]|nr:endolytic transglycosylase MltG [Rhodospirillales bacterium]